MPRYYRDKIFFDAEKFEFSRHAETLAHERCVKEMEEETIESNRNVQAYKKFSNDQLKYYAEKNRNKI